MGGPRFGRLMIDGQFVASGVARGSLVWSRGGVLLAVQELATWQDAPRTRVIVFDTREKRRIAASPTRTGLSTPVRFAGTELIYRQWSERGGEQILSLHVLK